MVYGGSTRVTPESHNKRRKGRGKERKAPMHLILKLTHATNITKIGKTARYVAKWWCLSVKIHLSDVVKDLKKRFQLLDQE